MANPNILPMKTNSLPETLLLILILAVIMSCVAHTTYCVLKYIFT